MKTITSKTIKAMAAAMALALAGGQPAMAKPSPHQPWWHHAVIYEIYPRSFQDSNGDGVGDLNGVRQRLDYLKKLGVDAIWLTPFYPSPNRDFGYDVADYTNVAPEYGTMADFDRLVAAAKQRGIRVLVDFVLNHSSDQHPWFKAAQSSRTNPKRDWYVWRDPAPDGGPPNNWRSIFGGSAWTRDPKSGQYYYHIFLPQQPDLNWRNPQLRKAMADVMRFWLKHGAAGFRLDATPYLFEDPAWPNDPDPAHGPDVGLKPYNSNLPETRAALRTLRKVVDAYSGERILLGENAIATIADLRRVYGSKADEINLPMDFLYTGMKTLDAATIKARIDEAELHLDGLPPVFHFSNHDTSRQATRFGDGVHDQAIARLTATLTLTLKGTALVYYGEELGMSDLPETLLANVPLGPKRTVADKRDPERTPMQWTAGPNAGFTTGGPWLPANPDRATINAAAESADPGSLFNWYRTLQRLRHDDPALREGAYVSLQAGDPHVVAYARTTKDGSGMLVLLNVGATLAKPAITGWPGKAPALGPVILGSASGDLDPWEVRLVRLTP